MRCSADDGFRSGCAPSDRAALLAQPRPQGDVTAPTSSSLAARPQVSGWGSDSDGVTITQIDSRTRSLARHGALACLLAAAGFGSAATAASAQDSAPCPPGATPAACAEPQPAPPAPAPPAGQPGVDARGVDPAAPNPLVGQTWYTDQVWGLPARAARAYDSRGQKGRAAMMRMIADRPQFRWFGGWISKEKGGRPARSAATSSASSRSSPERSRR